MSVSTDGQICFGILLPEEAELPWQADDDIDEWWKRLQGYVPEPQLFDGDGMWLGGVAPPREQVDAWLAHMRAWEVDNPLPVEPVNCCSGNYPRWILAVPGTTVTAHRGYPVKLEGIDLQQKPDTEVLLDFCEKYGIEFEGQPAWYLSSFWP